MWECINHVGLGSHRSTMYHYEMQKKFGVYTTFSVDEKKFHPIPIGYVSKRLIPIK